jgi:hypothetical protein
MKRDTDISQEVALIWNTANDVLRDIFQRTWLEENKKRL